jgi:hypothetical protein
MAPAELLEGAADPEAARSAKGRAADRHQGAHHGALGLVSNHIGLDRTRLNRIDRDPARPEIARKAASHGGNSSFRHAVDGRSCKAGAVGRDAACGDKAAGFAHVRQSCLDSDKDRTDIDRDHPIEICNVVVIRHATDVNSGIVDKNVDAAQAIDGLCHGSFHRVGIGTVGLDRQRRPAGLLDLGGKRLRAILRCGIAEGDVRAIARQPAPMPRDPPVTRATLPASWFDMTTISPFWIRQSIIGQKIRQLLEASKRHAGDASKIFRRCAGPGRHLDRDERGTDEARRFARIHVVSDGPFRLGFGDTAFKSGEQRAVRRLRQHCHFGTCPAELGAP